MTSFSLRSALSWRLGADLVAAIALVVLSTAAGHASTSSESTSGPAFSTTPEARADALVCPTSLAGATVDPVLLIHGTTVDPQKNFSWNWMPALDADGVPWCSVELLDKGMGDIQDSAEFVVHAIRTMHAEAGRNIDIVGHSQGGMVGRWALKWWPDTRSLVDDLIGLAPSNHGTLTAEPMCETGCAPAIHQQQASSAFMAALNADTETFAGVDYTSVYTRLDAVVTPNLDATGSSSLRTGDGTIANIATQDVCPTSTADHLSIGTYDAVGHAVARDALDHDGPASIDRIDVAVCAQPYMPGVDPGTAIADYGETAAFLASTLASSPRVDGEPELRCYVTDSCVQIADADQQEGAEVAGSSARPPSADGATLPATGGPPWLLGLGICFGGVALAARPLTRRAR